MMSLRCLYGELAIRQSWPTGTHPNLNSPIVISMHERKSLSHTLCGQNLALQMLSKDPHLVVAMCFPRT
jgi:hypothetical protein